MTKRVEPRDVSSVLDNHLRRIRALEALDPPTGTGMDPKYMGPSNLYLPVLEANSVQNSLASSTVPTWTLDTGYPHNGYLQLNADAAYIAWPIVLGPRGSYWMPIPLLDEGPDRGIVKLEIGTAEYEDDGNGWPGTFESYSTVGTFATVATIDCYNAVENKYPGRSQVSSEIQITGVDGAVGTTFSVGQWNGGSGPIWVRLRVDGKHVSSAGHRMRLSSFVFQRLGNDLLV